MNLLQRMSGKRRFAPSGDIDWPTPYWFGGSQPVNGQERGDPGDFIVAAERIMKRSGPVASLMFVRQRVFSEARLQFQQIRGGRPGDLFGTQDLSILEHPWPGGTTGDLLSRMIFDADLCGNAFLTIKNGRIKRLRPDWVTIVTGSHEEPDLYGNALDGELVGYIYNPRAPGSLEGDVLLPHEVAHFAPIPDPTFQFRGMSWLTPVINEIKGDNAATEHKLNFFRNGATPQIVVSVDASVTPENFDRLKAKMDAGHRGVGNAYKTMYVGGGADVTAIGADLRQLDFKATQGAGETRLASAAGVPAAIAGFSEGLQGSSLNAGTHAAARRSFADLTMRPLWRNVAGSLEHLVNVPSGSRLWYDGRDVAFLQEDQKDDAEISQTQAVTIRTYIDAGFEPGSAVAAVTSGDKSLLKHSGLYSVQLQPPNSVTTVADPKAVDPPNIPTAVEAPRKGAKV